MINHVFNIADRAMGIKPAFVEIDYNAVEVLANDMKLNGIEPFFDSTDDGYQIGVRNEILKELVAGSINYCYWYGASNLRPNDCSSTKMYDCVELAFRDNKAFDQRMEHLIELLSINRFPLLEERKRHLLELCNGKAERFADFVVDKKADLDLICRYFHGYASDMFLKRASLFFIQIYRKYGWFADMKLPVPADYQVPKILKHYRCLYYKPELEEAIYENQLIPEGSIQEIQIRAATIIVCEELARKLNWHIGDVDTFLWTRRKETDENFHLTRTIAY